MDDETLAACTEEGYFYIQYICQMPESLNAFRQTIGLGLSCLTIFLYFFYVVYFDYIDTVQKCKCVEYDFKTITGADYTIEFDLTAKQYEKW